MMFHFNRQAALALVVLLLLTAFNESRSNADQSAPPVTVGTESRERAFLGLFGGYSADYEPFGSTDEMAAASNLVVSGFISDVVAGRTWYPGAVDESLSVIIQMAAVEEIYQGNLPGAANGEVRFEIQSGNVSAEKYAEFVPKQSRVLLYLTDALETGDGYGKIALGAAAVESVAGLKSPVNPQGFLVEVGDNSVALPLDAEIHKGHTIEDYLPGSSEVP